MTKAELKELSIKELLLLADKVLNLYVAASVDPKHKLLAKQRQVDLEELYKIISEKENLK